MAGNLYFPQTPMLQPNGYVSREWLAWFQNPQVNSINFLNPIGFLSGGTGLSATPLAGQLLIGTGSGYTLSTLTAGAGITVTSAPGSITIAGSGVTSVAAGTGISVSSSTGAVTVNLANTAVTAASYGSASSVTTFTVNAQGQFTAAVDTPISIPASAINTAIPNSGLANSSVTINGSAVSLGGSTTVTASTTSKLTFNNGGSGVASGTSFDGSSAYTISYNTIGASPLAGSSSLTTLGTVTTGTWNASTIGVAYGGTGATTLTGYVKGSGTSALTAVASIPNTDVSGLGTMSTQSASSVAITGGTINGTAIGGTTAAAGTFTTLSATSNAVGSVTAATGGLTAVTAVTGSLTLATGGVNLASQVMASGSVWRVVAYGTYAAASSANVRALTMACYWGSSALTSVTTGNVLASTAQTTPWRVEMEISGSSATAAWCTSVLSAQVTSATIPFNYVGTPTSVTGLTTTSTLDFRVGQTGTATSGDTINVHSVTIERIK
jgi:hypothetical protein